MHSAATFEQPGLHEMSDIAATNNPNRIAYGEAASGRKVTWKEFENRSCRIANAFDEYCGQGDRIAFLCDCSIAHTTLLNGALKTGCIVSNLHTRASVETLRYCIDTISPRILVLDEEFSELVEEELLRSTSTDIAAIITTGQERVEYEQSHESLIEAHQSDAPDIRIREDDVACVQWTSGTTGRPKGWCHTHRGLGYKGIQLEKLLALDRTAAQAHVFTPSFAAWYSLFLPALYSSASTYFLSKWDPEAYVRLIDEEEITTADLVPTMWQEILELDSLSKYDLSSLNRAITSGEYLDEQTFWALREEICDDIYNSYAATEVLGTDVSAEEIENGRIGTVGKPISATRIRVIDEGGDPNAIKEPGEVGEIVINGPDCAVWAWKDTKRTEHVFKDGWWYSGDLGYKDEDGYLYIEGRTDFMIKSKGIKVAPMPIEERLKAHPGIEQAAVVGIPDDEYGEMVTAIVRKSDSDVTSDELETWCLESEEIARFERPRKYQFVDSPFPRTATGKLDRANVTAMLDLNQK